MDIPSPADARVSPESGVSCCYRKSHRTLTLGTEADDVDGVGVSAERAEVFCAWLVRVLQYSVGRSVAYVLVRMDEPELGDVLLI